MRGRQHDSTRGRAMQMRLHWQLICGAASGVNAQRQRGTLHDPSSITPAFDIWTASAPSWACLDPALKTVVGQPLA
jgi:hypothetical protein